MRGATFRFHRLQIPARATLTALGGSVSRVSKTNTLLYALICASFRSFTCAVACCVVRLSRVGLLRIALGGLECHCGFLCAETNVLVRLLLLYGSHFLSKDALLSYNYEPTPVGWQSGGADSFQRFNESMAVIASMTGSVADTPVAAQTAGNAGCHLQ